MSIISSPGPKFKLQKLYQLIQKAPRADAWKKEVLIFLGLKEFLATSFNASAKNCKRPLSPTTWGPSLRWANASSFRSQDVKNRTCKNINKNDKNTNTHPIISLKLIKFTIINIRIRLVNTKFLKSLIQLLVLPKFYIEKNMSLIVYW